MSLFWLRHDSWLVYVACMMGVLAQMEQLAIALTLRTFEADMVSWWHVLRAQAAAKESWDGS